MRPKIGLDPEMLRDLYSKGGLTLKQVARRLGCDQATVRARLVEHGIPLRPRGASGARNASWKGGRTIDGNPESGYILLRRSNPSSGKRTYLREHLAIWEAAHGPIPDGYVVHHVNGNKQDNRLENLQLMSSADHSRLHMSGRVVTSQTRKRMSDASRRFANPRHPFPISEANIEEDIARVSKKLGGGYLSYEAYRRAGGRYSLSVIRLPFDTWMVAKLVAGVD